MQPTERQLSAAHDAWEATASQWRLRRVNNYGLRADTWLVENVPSATFERGRDYANETAYYKYDGPDAEQQARWTLRDKIVKAVIAAVIARQEG